MTVRAAEPPDLPAITYLDELSNPYPWGAKFIKDALLKRFNLVYESHNRPRIKGFLTSSLVAGVAELELIVVDLNVRQQGIAKQLLMHWIDVHLQQEVVEFLLEVRCFNIPAIRLYESLGFDIVGTRKNYYATNEGYEDAFLMTLITTEKE